MPGGPFEFLRQIIENAKTEPTPAVREAGRRFVLGQAPLGEFPRALSHERQRHRR